MKKKALWISGICVLALVLAAALFVLFFGGIQIAYESDSFGVYATLREDCHVKYSSVKNMELRDDFEVGKRKDGLFSARFLSGTFENEEFGSYTLYAKRNADSYLVISREEGALVIGFAEKEGAETVMEKLSRQCALGD